MLPQINENMTVNELTRLNDVLRKNSSDMLAKSQSEVGYQSGIGSAVGGGSLAPIVPQSIESVLASATFTMNDLVLWQKLPKVQVTNTIHEYAVINEHGQDLDPFISEGGGGSDFGSSLSSYERRSVKIKYMAERRQISDVANLVGIIGANPNALAEETERGTMSLMRKVENQLFWGDEEANSRGFDGILKQIERPGTSENDLQLSALSDNTHDVGGALAGFQLAQTMNDVLGELHSAPRFGRPDVVFVEPRVYSQMIRASIESGRNDQLLVTGAGSTATFGAGPQVHIMGPMGPVPVLSAPFLHRQFKAPSAASSSASPTLNAAAANLSALADAAGQAGGLDNAKFYKYKVVGVSQAGYSAPLVVDDGAGGGVQPTGDGLQFSLGALGAMKGGYYRIYRSAGAAAAGDVDLDSCVLIAEIPTDPGQNDGSVTFKDRGVERHSCGRALFMQMDQNVVEFARLLDFLRRPLAETSAAKQFLLMLFGSPIVKVPQKCFTLRGIPYTEVF